MWTRRLLLATYALFSVGYVTAQATDAASTSDANFTVEGAAPAFGVGLPAGLAALGSQQSAEALHRRQVFYLGAQYVTNSTTNFTTAVNQMYVEQLLPAAGVSQSNPIVFFHGGGFTGVVSRSTMTRREIDEPDRVRQTDVVTNARQSPGLGILFPEQRLRGLPGRCQFHRTVREAAGPAAERRSPGGTRRGLLLRLAGLPAKLSAGQTAHAVARVGLEG